MSSIAKELNKYSPHVGKNKLHDILDARRKHKKLPKIDVKKHDKPVYKQISIEDYESGAYDQARKAEKEIGSYTPEAKSRALKRKK